jgi:hypothetical protein
MKKTLLIATIFTVYILGYYGASGLAFAQYMGSVGSAGETGQNTLEETLELAKRRIEAVQNNPAAGSGTPIISADGVIGAAAISAAIFGGIAGVLFFKGKQGKYAAQGQG